MVGKAGRDFFEYRQEWSKYKHLVLDYYLRPYLAHVNRRNAPILLVDLFAGPGKYGDGSIGSPLILAEAAQRYVERPHGISVIAIEKDDHLHERLIANAEPYRAFVDIRHADCTDVIDEIASRAQSATTFLYVDPFNTGRLHLEKLGRIFRRISQGGSVELLFVFMANAFLRWAGACLRAENDAEHVLDDVMVSSAPDTETMLMMARALWDSESVKDAKLAIKSRTELDAIAGGDYWRDFATSRVDAAQGDRLTKLVDAYCAKLRQWFPVVVSFPIHASVDMQLRKYWMVFSTRYEPAIDFINSAAAAVRRDEFKQWKSDTLFAEVDAPRPVRRDVLRARILGCIPETSSIEWGQLRWKVAALELGAFTEGEINQGIKRMLTTGLILGAEGRKVEERARIRKSNL